MRMKSRCSPAASRTVSWFQNTVRSEEHTSELQSRLHLVCRLLLEKKKNNQPYHTFLTPSCNRPHFTPSTTCRTTALTKPTDAHDVTSIKLTSSLTRAPSTARVRPL